MRIEKLDLLISFYIFCICASELMGGKTFALMTIGSYHLNASVAILLLPFVFTINDIIVEVYGPERARSIVRSGLLVVASILLFSLIATVLPPSTRFLATEKAYDTIFGTSARIALASLLAFTTAEFTDVLIFTKLRKVLGKKSLWIRNNVSNIVSQFLDTTIFMVFAFYSFNQPISSNVAFLSGIILPYWLLKCVMSVVETPFVYLGVAWLKEKRE
jgi:uncharacterized integral membrane protein (TIGR00697 family)